MSSHIELIKSGFSLVDSKWGGFYRGGSYLIIGARKSGRTILALQSAKASAENGETCLFFTTMRPKDLMIQAASIGFDIQEYMDKNRVIVVRVSSPDDAYSSRNKDEMLIEYLEDIITISEQYSANRLIFDEITPYVGFSSLSLLKDVFESILEKIEDRDITSLFVIGEPASDRTEIIVDSIAQFVTGIIKLEKDEAIRHGNYHGGEATITPNVGHTEGVFRMPYVLEPQKGLTVKSLEKEFYDKVPEVEIVQPQPVKDKKSFLKKTKLSIPQNETVSLASIYNYNDFSLLINNQIALFKSTGQKFDLVSFKIDPSLTAKGLISVNQFRDALKYAIGKRDKICVYENQVLLLVLNPSDEEIARILDEIKEFLPSQDRSYVKVIYESVKILRLEIDNSVENADTLLDYITGDNQKAEKHYIPLFDLVEL